jgi:BirA family biotin operon repressor/biotin-[acetyl-CoA-carboxylase] ligase
MAKHIHLHEVSSTNDMAYELALKGANHLTAVSSDIQTKGRGRRGNIWSTIPFKSVAASFVVRRSKSDLLPFSISLAVLKTVQTFVNHAVIKWPNDILIESQKVSGILIERYTQGEAFFYIVGIGINVNTFENDFFDKTVNATSLELHANQPLDVKHVFEKLQESIAQCLFMSSEDILSDYRKSCATIGSYVTWRNNNQILTGLVKNISDSGSLNIELENGEIQEILSGEIIAQK